MTPETREALFSSATDEWSTPDSFMARLPFTFDLDVCATPENAKAPRYFTKEQDGLVQDWKGTCWMNPPYGKDIEAWVQKASVSAMDGATVVCLLPARTDTKWWHSWIWDEVRDEPYRNVSIHFIRGRLKFGGAKNSAPFPSVVVVFRPWEVG